eukprot:CAMPEP_0183734656 /NCGR_PEP_ID=MMETSP0737-20130205/44425_1 /TAXON_ID=385413 /ORGANISM="Thalassiosira miniscula, Strain CCMP1093" /LENGTH=420 /DNA_ID=CAMNT_0025968205 /DNA_START=11 /DNA_END=1273 /DNA_ORIENTATION=-
MSATSATIPSSSRAIQSLVAMGALIAAAASIYILQTRRQRRSSDDDADARGSTRSSASAIDDETNYYRHLGVTEENLPTHIQREIYKERKRKAKVELISMKTPMYDNVYMLDTNRERMCTISMKKAKWYIRKGIAEWSTFKDDDGGCDGMDNNNTAEEGGEEEVKCIRLLFQHNKPNADRSSDEVLYLQSAKQNVCVACGSDGHHIRHYIVPYSYRTLLPEEYKNHMSHDIVILCPDCHLACERPTKRRMKDMEYELRMKLVEEDGAAAEMSPVIEDPHLHHIRGCAIALVKWKDNMPSEKIAGYEKEVREYLASLCNNNKEDERISLLEAKEELTKAQLQKACSVNYRVKNPNFIPGSEVVVRSLNDDGKKIEEFIIDWRKYFLATVNPQHMPTGWRVDNPVLCGSRNGDDAKDGLKSW